MKKQSLYFLLFLSINFADPESFYSDSYAVLIGINKYQERPLDYAVADAEDIKSLLIDKFNFPENNVSLITDEEATRENIKDELFRVAKSTKKNDRLLVFFAGHGETLQLDDGGDVGYLIPVDGDFNNLYTSAISMNEIRQISSIASAKHILFLVDACYGGLLAVDSRGLGLDRKTEGYLKKITKDKARQVITAGGKGERVFEKAEWGHSAFTKNLISGLKDELADMDDDGYITANELGTYLKKKVTVDSHNIQTPQNKRLTSDEGEFVFKTDFSTEPKNKTMEMSSGKIEKVESDGVESRDKSNELLYAKSLKPEQFMVSLCLQYMDSHNLMNNSAYLLGAVYSGYLKNGNNEISLTGTFNHLSDNENFEGEKLFIFNLEL